MARFSFKRGAEAPQPQRLVVSDPADEAAATDANAAPAEAKAKVHIGRLSLTVERRR